MEHFKPRATHHDKLRFEMYSGEEGEVVKATLSYDKGGLNYFNYKNDPRGIGLSIIPMKLDPRTSTGFRVESWMPFAEGRESGLRFFVLPLKRLDRKKLVAAAEALDAAVWTAIAVWRENREAAIEIIREAVARVSTPAERDAARLEAALVPKPPEPKGMLLLTEEIKAKLPPLGAQSEVADPIAYAKFFTPDSNWTWYATEGEAEGDDFRFFGRVDGHESELGYFLLSELKEVKGGIGLHVERDKGWTPRPLSQARDTSARQMGA